MKHIVTDTDIIVPVREVMNKYISVVGERSPTVYICEVFRNAFKQHKIANWALTSGHNAIVQQMCYKLGVSLSDEELEELDWSWGVEDAFDSDTLNEFYHEGNRIVYGPECEHGCYEYRWVNPKDQILVRIGMMSRMIETFGEDAIFCIPLAGF